MNYLIKIIFFLLVSFKVIASENIINEILFKINNKVFTKIDLEKRTEYIALSNNLNVSELSASENNEILNDYISSLIFYEYYIQNKKFYSNLKNEIDLAYKKISQKTKKLNATQIENLKFNSSIDLVRNKIIEEELNSKKTNLSL